MGRLVHVVEPLSLPAALKFKRDADTNSGGVSSRFDTIFGPTRDKSAAVNAAAPKKADTRISPQVSKPGDPYLARVVKYIPSEIVAGYVALNTLVESVPSDMKLLLSGIAFAGCLILTPFYYLKQAEEGDAVRSHVVLATASFVIWAYALGTGFAQALGIYEPAIAAMLCILGSLIIGVFPLKIRKK